jgi:hypothetical protein
LRPRRYRKATWGRRRTASPPSTPRTFRGFAL